MDAGQVMTMPATASSASAVMESPVGAGTTPGEATASLFGSLLGQRILGMVSANSSLPTLTAGSVNKPQAAVPITEEPKEAVETKKGDVDPSDVNSMLAGQLAAVYAQMVSSQAAPLVQSKPDEAAVAEPVVKETTGINGIGNVSTLLHQDAVLNGGEAVVATPHVQHEGIENEVKAAVAVKNETESPVTVQHASGGIEAKLAAVIAEGRVDQKLQSLQGVQKNNAMPQGKQEDSLKAAENQNPAVDGANVDRQVQQKTDGQVQQKAAETQLLSSKDVPADIKSTTTVVQQPVRFAQRPDVVQAATDTAQQGNGNSSGDGQPNGQAESKLGKAMPVRTEAVLSEVSADSVTTDQPTAIHYTNGGQSVHQVAKTDEVTVPEQPRSLAGDQVSRQVADRLVSHELKQGNDQISLKLSPEHLGNLQLNLRMEDQHLKLEIVAEHRGVRDALLQQVDDLRETLAKQNIRMDSFDVTTGNGGGSQSQQSRGDWRQMGSEQRQYANQYASSGRSGGSAAETLQTPVRYFTQQYQSTIDVRF